MHVKAIRPGTDPYLRSLLQKAVRRGFATIASRVAQRLVKLGDSRWLRSRAVVLSYEEAWPAAERMKLDASPESKIAWVESLSKARKQKDAAGFGSLAFALSEGDESVLEMAPDRKALKILAEGIKRPTAYWQWLEASNSDEQTGTFISNARKHFSAPTWPWDKAFVMAGAYLRKFEKFEGLGEAETASNGVMPIWVAVDKHTPLGKQSLAQIARDSDIPLRVLTWANFYFSSAATNELECSRWWDAERAWRFQKVGVTEQRAADVWLSVGEQFRTLVKSESQRLERIVEGVPKHDEPQTLELRGTPSLF